MIADVGHGRHEGRAAQGERVGRYTPNCWRADEPEHLIRQGLIANPSSSADPSGTDTEASAGVLPRRASVPLRCPVGPLPRAIRSGAHVGLDRNPIGAGRQYNRGTQGHLEHAGVVNVRLSRRSTNLCPRQAGVIRVEKDVEVVGWTSSVQIYTLCVYLGNSPHLVRRNDEIVSSKGVRTGKIRKFLR